MRRREFITLLGGAAAPWPVVARGQQLGMPVIGYLSIGSPQSDAARLTGLRQGLNEAGYIEGRELVIEYRWAGISADPVQVGLVASPNRPGGNLTGFNQFNSELGAKGLALLHQLVPNAATIAFLENPNNPIDHFIERDVRVAARVIGLQIHTLKASTIPEIDAAFESLVQARTGHCLSVMTCS